jgi:alanine dehydrogenase
MVNWLPRMTKELGNGEFLPEFIQFLVREGANIFLEEGYSSRSGFTFNDTARKSSSAPVQP